MQSASLTRSHVSTSDSESVLNAAEVGMKVRKVDSVLNALVRSTSGPTHYLFLNPATVMLSPLFSPPSSPNSSGFKATGGLHLPKWSGPTSSVGEGFKRRELPV